MARRTWTMARALLLAIGVVAAVGAVLLQGQRPVTAQTATPDIELRAFTASVSGTTVDFSLTVCVNNALPGAFQVKIWMNLASRPTCTTAAPDVSAPLTFSGLGCQTIPLQLTGVAVGTYTTRVLLDGTCAVTESDEFNNTRFVTYTVLGTVTYTKGPGLYVGISSGTHRSNGGTMAMNADCHATYPGSRLCTERDIANTYPAPLPPKDAWVLSTPGVYHDSSVVGSGTGSDRYPTCSSIAWPPFQTSYRGDRGLVLAASGEDHLKRVGCFIGGDTSKPVAYPAACCRP